MSSAAQDRLCGRCGHYKSGHGEDGCDTEVRADRSRPMSDAAQDRRDPVARALLADEGQKELRAKRRAVDARLAEDQAATITESRKDEMDDVEMSGRSDPPFSKHGWVGGFRGLDAPSADPTAGLFHLPTTEGRPWRVELPGLDEGTPARQVASDERAEG